MMKRPGLALPDPTQPNSTLPGPAMILFDALYLSRFKWCRIEFLTQCGIWFQIIVGNFELQIFDGFAYTVSRQAFFHTFFGITQEPYNILKI